MSISNISLIAYFGVFMVTFRIGDMFRDCFESKVDFFVTTNRVIKRNGELVMGAGVAKQARDLWPHLPSDFGKAITIFHKDKATYFLLPPVKVVPLPKEAKVTDWQVGAIQTKINWRDPSPLQLVQASIRHLESYGVQQYTKSGTRILHCVLPGIGKGGLDFWTVLNFCKDIPLNVTFWIHPSFVEERLAKNLEISAK